MFKVKGEELEIIVDKASPLLPPLEYVRENSHVTAEEWKALRGESFECGLDLCKQVIDGATSPQFRTQNTEEAIFSNFKQKRVHLNYISDTSFIL